MILAVILLSILGYALAAVLMDSTPKFGYAMTFPLRILFPIMTYYNTQSLDGLVLGLGFGFLLSFENKIFWKVGMLLILSYGQWG